MDIKYDMNLFLLFIRLVIKSLLNSFLECVIEGFRLEIRDLEIGKLK